MELKDKIIEALKGSESPLKAGEIAELIEVEKAEVDKALKSLKKDETVISPKRCYYSVNK